MKRLLTDHMVPGDSVNHQLEIAVTDEPGAGGANHRYLITGFGRTQTNPSRDIDKDQLDYASIVFQNGPIKEVGVNGLTHEVLLAIVIDRMRSFQAGPYSDPNNQIALEHVEKALGYLQIRTIERIKRGVEGTHQK